MQNDDLIADLLDGLRVQLPGADDPLILYTLRDRVRELCRLGRVWMVERETPATANLGVLRTSTMTGFGELAWLEAVTFNGQPLHYRDLGYVRDKPIAGKPAWYAFELPDRIYLNPIITQPARGDFFSIHAALQPRLGEDPLRALQNVPVHIFTRFTQALHEGVLGRLLAMPGKPWSNSALAGVYLRSFQGSARMARVESSRAAGANQRPQWRFPAPAARGRF